MYIPNAVIIPLFIVSFILLAVQYYRVDPDRRLLDLRFGMMTGAVVLMFVAVSQGSFTLSPILFLLGLVWVGVSLYLMRMLPPPRH